MEGPDPTEMGLGRLREVIKAPGRELMLRKVSVKEKKLQCELRN